MDRQEEVEAVFKQMQQLGLAATESDAAIILSTIDIIRVSSPGAVVQPAVPSLPPISRTSDPRLRALQFSATQGVVMASPASNDVPSRHADLARVRDANIVAAEIASGVRSA